jgi:hypothetical protein
MNFDLGPLGSISSGDIVGGIGAAGALGGGVLGGIGGIIGAGGAQQAGAAQAAAYTANAGVAGTTAANTRLSLSRAQQESDYLANRTIGRQRAGYAAGGINVDSGSPLDVMGDTENQIKFEAMNRFYAGEEAAKTASDQAAFDTTAAAAAKKAADTNSTSSLIGGGASLLSGIGSAVKIITSIL